MHWHWLPRLSPSCRSAGYCLMPLGWRAPRCRTYFLGRCQWWKSCAWTCLPCRPGCRSAGVPDLMPCLPSGSSLYGWGISQASCHCNGPMALHGCTAWNFLRLIPMQPGCQRAHSNCLPSGQLASAHSSGSLSLCQAWQKVCRLSGWRRAAFPSSKDCKWPVLPIPVTSGAGCTTVVGSFGLAWERAPLVMQATKVAGLSCPSRPPKLSPAHQAPR